jgi:hypothetical protein
VCDNLRESNKFVGAIVIILAILTSTILAIPMQSIGTEDSNKSMYGTINGRVIDDKTDEPINYALMTLKYHEETHFTVTDSNGVYSFYKVPICFCLKNVSSEKTGYQVQNRFVPVDKITYVNFSLVPIEDQPKDNPDPGEPEDNEKDKGGVKGVVIDAVTSYPIDKVYIALEYHGIIHSTYTDSEGKYSFSDIPECNCSKDISADKEGYETQHFQIGVYRVTYVNFSLEPIKDPKEPKEPNNGMYGTIYGTVMGTESKLPIKNAKVNLKYHDKIQNTKTNSEGEFKFTNVPICYCLKNLTVTKDDYKTQSKQIPVNESTTVFFFLDKTNDEIVPPQDLPPKSDDIQGKYTEDQLYGDLNGLGITIIGIVSIIVILFISGGLFFVLKKKNHLEK